jgi:hypothetical protein
MPSPNGNVTCVENDAGAKFDTTTCVETDAGGKVDKTTCVETDAGKTFDKTTCVETDAGGKFDKTTCVETDASKKFDYADLAGEARLQVTRLTRKIKKLADRSAQDIVDIGRHLIAAKKHLPHGLFGEWLHDEFRWTTRQAQRFMNVAEEFGKYDNLSHLGPSVLYLLASPSTPNAARQEALATAAAGEQVTHARAKEIVSRHRPGGGSRKGKAQAAAGDAGSPQEQVQGAAVAEEQPAVKERPAGQILEGLSGQLESFAADARRAVLLPEHEHGRELEKLLDRIAAALARARETL